MLLLDCARIILATDLHGKAFRQQQQGDILAMGRRDHPFVDIQVSLQFLKHRENLFQIGK